MIQKDIFRDKMAILDICVNANVPPEKMEIFYQVVSPRMTTEGFLSSFEKILTGQVKLFGAITTADIISGCDEFLTMEEKSKSLINRARYSANQLYEQPESVEYEKVIVELYGSRDRFNEWKEEIKTKDEPVEYWRKKHKENFLEMARKIITEESFKEYGIETKETQGLLQ